MICTYVRDRLPTRHPKYLDNLILLYDNILVVRLLLPQLLIWSMWCDVLHLCLFISLCVIPIYYHKIFIYICHLHVRLFFQAILFSLGLSLHVILIAFRY